MLCKQFFLPSTSVPPPRYGFIYSTTFSLPQNKKQHEVTIRDFSTYTCMDFITMMASLLGGQGKWVHCKHMYYILQHVMYCGQWKNSFVIQLKVGIKFNNNKIVLSKLSFVQCIEWSIIQKCRLVTCASGQYVIVILTFVLCSFIQLHSWMWNAL